MPIESLAWEVGLIEGPRVDGAAKYFSGTADVRIELPARAVTSPGFGGADLRDMYAVTADNTDDPVRAGTIFRIRCEIAGLPGPLARI
jgi:sugar lactone lactonase YvrE